jgi:uncharacterized protein (DUF302 family)
MDYARTITLDLPYDDAVPAVKEAFAEQGFGTLTEIDVQATLASKIGAEIEPYVILGACNPHLAARALDTDRLIGLLLPCNVVVRADGDRTIVHALDPRLIAEIPERPELEPIAAEAGERIDAALAALASVAR